MTSKTGILMNLNAKRQGVTPLSFEKPCEFQSTITELAGLLESRQLAWLDICEGENKAIIFRSNLRKSVFRNIQFASLIINRCYIDGLCFENCDMRNVFFSNSTVTQPIRLRHCQVAGMRLLNMSLRMFIFEECTGVGQIVIA
ncbi:hypothetical protein MXM41_20775 [Leclercia adecarboxylata]|uniref:hypothetical protein n=1 Tax=Leclercia adecarboxylata TaxID=83655 RepID=UPI002DB5F2E5|nr:hypothetical protein [Leclercia adecarboxylata]MEB6381343.1 hypothetical protein [Leclercia adecarboxylata]